MQNAKISGRLTRIWRCRRQRQPAQHICQKTRQRRKKRRLPDKGRTQIKRSRWLQFFILNLAIYPDPCVILSAAELRFAHASCSHILPAASARTGRGAEGLRGGPSAGGPGPCSSLRMRTQALLDARQLRGPHGSTGGTVTGP